MLLQARLNNLRGGPDAPGRYNVDEHTIHGSVRVLDTCESSALELALEILSKVADLV
jgi:hypothetical protein